MAIDFDDVRLPEDIERDTTGGPDFRTTVIRLINGAEQRNQEWELPLDQYNIAYGIQKREDMEAVYEFFHARNGRARGFRFRNWLDYSVTGSPVGLIPGEPTKRQLIRVYDDTANAEHRIITRPVLSTLKVYRDMVLTTNYSIEPLGVLAFPDDPGANVLASFEFDIPVRFDIDRLSVRLSTFQAGSIPSIQLIELRE